jgi:hypothetical protein
MRSLDKPVFRLAADEILGAVFGNVPVPNFGLAENGGFIGHGNALVGQ